MDQTWVVREVENLPVMDGAHQLDGAREDPFSTFLLSNTLSTNLIHHFACDCVERAMLRERDAGHELPFQYWEILLTKRLYLAGESSAEMLLESRIAASVVSWKKKRSRNKTPGARDELQLKVLAAAQLLAETDNTWQIDAVRYATEAAAWAESLHCENSPLFWLQPSEEKMLKHWVSGWNQERKWQRDRLLKIIQTQPQHHSLPILQTA